MRTILALDPGKTTGWSYWEYDDETPAQCIVWGQTINGVQGYIEEHFDKTPDLIVSEQFVLDGRTPNPDITPLQIEGVILAQANVHNLQVVFQRNNFKKHVDNELLKKHRLYWAGNQHAMDSSRHALAYLKTTMHMPTLKHYFMLD